MKRVNWTAIGVAALAVALLCFPVAQAQERDLTAAVQDALLTNPDVAEARNQWLARREEVRQAEGAYLPSVDLNAGIGYEYTDSPSTRSSGRGSAELDRRELGLNIRQMLFDGWGTRSEVERQTARTDSAAARLLSVGASTAMKACRPMSICNATAICADCLKTTSKSTSGSKTRSGCAARPVSADGPIMIRSSRASRCAEIDLVAADVNLLDAETTYQRVVGTLPATAMQAPQ